VVAAIGRLLTNAGPRLFAFVYEFPSNCLCDVYAMGSTVSRGAVHLTTISINQLQIGQKLDHYIIESLASQSGMACVYRATDLVNGRSVAIKVPHFEAESDPVFFDRFKREEEIGKRLDHPGVMKVLETDDRSRVYMVMEWIDGQLLRRILTDAKKLTVERAVRLTVKLCEALNYVHNQGVVHRDLKPENIMVASEDQIKLIDFGIASRSGARRLTFGKLTRTMGTADYISPEQVKSNRSDARSDLYAVGVMLYEMLTGELPFQGPNPLAVMNDRLLNDPVPPRERNPEISPQLQEIVYRALERKPEHRYASAREFANDLRNPDAVGVEERTEFRNWKIRRSTGPKRFVVFATLAMIPIILLILLLVAARH
jgi:serine/threonine protein kinase